MASTVGTAFTISAVPRRSVQAVNGISSLKSVSFSNQMKFFPTIRLQPALLRSPVSCAAAKPETMDKVCEIVKKQLALSEDISVTGESRFDELGADSLDTVEIVMTFEEAFGISVEEDTAQSIVTVQDAADMIDKLMEAKS